jgi:small membrane protein
MIAQLLLSFLLGAVLVYAFSERRRSPVVGALALAAAAAGLYFVWMPTHATTLAEIAGVGRGVDLIIYIWVVISLLLLLNLHLKLRTQTEAITRVARAIAIGEGLRAGSRTHLPAEPGGGDEVMRELSAAEPPAWHRTS